MTGELDMSNDHNYKGDQREPLTETGVESFHKPGVSKDQAERELNTTARSGRFLDSNPLDTIIMDEEVRDRQRLIDAHRTQPSNVEDPFLAKSEKD